MDELYLVPRRVLLDVIEALGAHREAIVLVGAQAIVGSGHPHPREASIFAQSAGAGVAGLVFCVP